MGAQVDVIHPFQFFEVCQDRFVYFFDAVHQDEDADLIRADLFPSDQVRNIFGDACESALEHCFILGVHADADGKFDSICLLHEGVDVVLAILLDLLEG